MRLIDGDALKKDWSMANKCEECPQDARKCQYYQNFTRMDICEMLDEAPTIGGWIPFVKRPLTDDEKNTHPDWCYILDGSVPEDEEEILLYRPWKNSEGYIITMDQYMNNGTECYLDGAGDIENGMFWMPLPEPPET